MPQRYSEQLAELVRRHADGGQNAAHGSLEQVLSTVDWHGDCAPVGMAHDVVATVDPRDFEASAL